jgi:regulatory protein SWI5
MQRHQSPQKTLIPTHGKSQSFEVADMPGPAVVDSSSPFPSELDEVESLPFFDETGGEQARTPPPDLKARPAPILTATHSRTGSQSPSRPALSPRRMSISDLNLEPGIKASIEETNVSIDDIAQFIEGPEPSDNKWVCRYEDCNKRFGRKENIKSHVQTHLGDRQFKCDHCNKCFVRGHDLKRHAKIHTGTKPYPCLCGNSFARHDALTRHRQRGMCIGAFEGIVKKPIKRGRPRKHRPEMDERIDKASRVRHAHDSMQYANSSSSGSPSSWGSPTENMDALSIRDSSPFDDASLFDLPRNGAGLINTDTTSFPPEMFNFTPPSSPQYSTGNRPSPSHYSPAPTDLGDFPQIPQQMPNDQSQMLAQEINMSLSHSLQSQQSQAQSLPALSQTGSSPPPAEMVSFDFAEMPMTMAGNNVSLTAPAGKANPQNDFDAFLDYGYDNGEIMGEDSLFAI